MKRNLRVFGTMTAGWVALAAFALTAYSQRGPAPVPGQPVGQPAAQAPAQRGAQGGGQGDGQRGQGLPGTETGWSRFRHVARRVI